ncbi:MAG: rRNA maturation RNase YbeY [Patescibacteria group bacterium]|nr:rRNA maturation RNase YbeY [Patescibacteria group bacterium]
MITTDLSGKLPSGVTKGLIESLAGAAFSAGGGKGDSRITVSVVDDKVMRQLNKRHRGIDSTTDVLSFMYSEEDFPIPDEESDHDLLGEIVISAPKVKKQAKEAGRTIKAEFSLMVVHGTLHLLGYDHCTDEDEREMFGLQQDILMEEGIL